MKFHELFDPPTTPGREDDPYHAFRGASYKLEKKAVAVPMATVITAYKVIDFFASIGWDSEDIQEVEARRVPTEWFCGKTEPWPFNEKAGGVPLCCKPPCSLGVALALERSGKIPIRHRQQAEPGDR